MRLLTPEEFQDEFPDFKFKQPGHEFVAEGFKIVKVLSFSIDEDGSVLQRSQMSSPGEGYSSDNLFTAVDYIGQLSGESE